MPTIFQSTPDITTVLTVGQGPAGRPGPSAETVERVAASAIGGHRLVCLIADTLVYASPANLGHVNRLIGLTMNAAGTGDLVVIRISGEITEPSWVWAVDQPIYLGANGFLTQVAPTKSTAAYTQVIGFAVTADRIFIHLSSPIILSE